VIINGRQDTSGHAGQFAGVEEADHQSVDAEDDSGAQAAVYANTPTAKEVSVRGR
jgi:hypothetical protein